MTQRQKPSEAYLRVLIAVGPEGMKVQLWEGHSCQFHLSFSLDLSKNAISADRKQPKSWSSSSLTEAMQAGKPLLLTKLLATPDIPSLDLLFSSVCVLFHFNYIYMMPRHLYISACPKYLMSIRQLALFLIDFPITLEEVIFFLKCCLFLQIELTMQIFSNSEHELLWRCNH